MRRRFIIVTALALVATQVACSRKSSSSRNADSGQQQSSMANSQEQARSYLESGKGFYRNDQDSEAAKAFEQAIKLDPNLSEAYFRLGLAYTSLGKEQDAEESFKKAVENYKRYFSNESNAKDAEAHYDLAQTYAGLHLYAEAVREYRQATHLKDDDADIYYDLGIALTRLAQYDEAVAAFSKSLEIDPDNFRAQDGLDDARAGLDRIKAGRKHQEELAKKEKQDEKGQTANSSAGAIASPSTTKKP